MVLLSRRRIKYVSRNCSKLQRWGIIGWSVLLCILHRVERKFYLKKCTMTLLAFCIFLMILPIFAIAFVVLGFYRQAMKWWISWSENGELELVDVTFRTAMETSEQTAIITIVFCVEGNLKEEMIRKWLTEIIYQKDLGTGRILHRNFQRQLIRVNGFFAWKREDNYSLDKHIFVAPSHHHGTTLTERNIQEYISELCSDPLNPGQSPWQVKIAEGISEGGNPLTWVIFRMHHLLTANLSLPDFPFSLPNPWDSGISSKGYLVLEAPNSTKRILLLLKDWIDVFTRKTFKLILRCIRHVLASRPNSYSFKKLMTSVRFYFTRWLCEEPAKLFHWIGVSFSEQNKIKLAKSILFQTLRNNFVCIFALIFIIILKTYHAYVYIKNAFIFLRLFLCNVYHGQNVWVNLFKEAILEMYWMLRAMLSLPRLLMEEMFATRGTVPLNIWRRKSTKNWRRTLVAWSEEVPLGGAEEIRGVTGASLSSVLLTALAGGIRDLVRYNGLQPPDHLRCTLPVYIPHVYPNQGLFPFPLPTGCSYGQKALRDVCRYIDRMKKYPETYLASVWLVKHASKFLPEVILKGFLKFLTARHPVLLINLVGPPSTSYLWGMKLKSTFYWRPPQHDAVISVCISSYCGRVSLGVLADGWVIPHAHILPQSFASHLNELAVETGVKLQRQNSRIWSRTSSPRSTPSSTPPSTPRVNSGWTPFSQFALYATLRKQRSLKQLMETRVNESSSSFLTKSYENLSLQIEATA